MANINEQAPITIQEMQEYNYRTYYEKMWEDYYMLRSQMVPEYNEYPEDEGEYRPGPGGGQDLDLVEILDQEEDMDLDLVEILDQEVDMDLDLVDILDQEVDMDLDLVDIPDQEVDMDLDLVDIPDQEVDMDLDLVDILDQEVVTDLADTLVMVDIQDTEDIFYGPDYDYNYFYYINSLYYPYYPYDPYYDYYDDTY